MEPAEYRYKLGLKRPKIISKQNLSNLKITSKKSKFLFDGKGIQKRIPTKFGQSVYFWVYEQSAQALGMLAE